MFGNDTKKSWRLKPTELNLSKIINPETQKPFQQGTESDSLIENLKRNDKKLVDISIQDFVRGIFQFLNLIL